LWLCHVVYSHLRAARVGSQEFNEYLQAITEHNDMAKVASLQNG
jgi:hypothetical protein